MGPAAVLALVAAALLAATTTADACRCAPRPLAAYAADADVVLLARVTEVRVADGPDAHRAVTLAPLEPAFKGDPSAVAFRTHLSSATCGIDPPLGAAYLVFASYDPARPGVAWFHSCDGSRPFDPRAGAAGGPTDFVDTPGPDVLPALRSLEPGTAAAPPPAAPAEPTPHTNPACWGGPRVFHAGPPPPDLHGRVAVARAPREPGDEAGERAPNGAYAFTVRPETAGTTAIRVFAERDDVIVLSLRKPAHPPAPRWITEKLLYVRAAWGRVVFTDLILDVERGALAYEEVAHDGTAAFQQYRAACGRRCPCEPGAEATPAALAPDASTLLGLVELPSILNHDVPPSVARPARSAPHPVPIRARPDAGAPVAGAIGAPGDVETREIGYEEKAAAVYARRPDWYLVGMRRAGAPGRAWIRAADAGAFTGVGELLTARRATHLTRTWNGRLWEAPGTDAHVAWLREPPAREHDVDVIESRTVAGRLWLRVDVLEPDRCSGRDAAVVARGWVPTYAADGALNVWYHSRGC